MDLTAMTQQVLSAICAFDVDAGGTVHRVSDLWPATEPSTAGGYRWLHLDMKDAALAAWGHAHLPKAVFDALTEPQTRPRCDAMEGGMILTLRGVNTNPGAKAEDMVSLRLWVREDRIITVRARRLMAVTTLRHRMEAGQPPATPIVLLCDLVRDLTDRIETVSLDLEEQVDMAEDALFSDGSDRETVDDKSRANVRQRIIKLRRFVGPQREALARIAAFDAPFVDARTRMLLRETTNRATRTVEELDANRDRLAVVQEHRDAQTAMLLGRNSYVLSIVAAIFLPLGFLTGLFGVNLAGMPGAQSVWAFGALCGGSVAVGIVLFVVFRWTKWL
ncbi:MAG: zinc transporter [Paracoccaceae bacterium]|jgi:zinc transporter